MTFLWLDYQQPHPYPWAGPLLLGVAALMAMLSMLYLFDLNDSAETVEQKLALMDRQGKHGMDAQRTRQSPQVLAQEVARANEVLQQLTLPWQELLQAVEAAGDRKVSLLSMEPDLEKHQVKISGEARDMMVLLNYISRLEAQAVFGQVDLQSHQVQLRDPDKPVRFVLLAAWKGRS
ncbi:MAG: PilN domain-containing protein [Sideroxydans sp.]|nr:PilN domain-containing protein [Sideroxydans sp.]